MNNNKNKLVTFIYLNRILMKKLRKYQCILNLLWEFYDYSKL